MILLVAIPLLRGAAVRNPGNWSPPVLALSVGAGVLASTALAAYLFALKFEIIIAVGLSSLHPVVPVIVGLLFLGERLRRSQAIGVIAALAATTVIALA